MITIKDTKSISDLDLEFEVLEEKEEFMCIINECIVDYSPIPCIVAIEGIPIDGVMAKIK